MNIQLSAAQIVDAVGGSDNIAGVTHCATRLRFEIRDTEKIRQDELKAIDGVLGVNMAGSQCQVIIGGDVVKFYPVVTKILGTDVTAAPAPKQAKGVKGGLMAILDYIAGTMTPLIPALIGCSMIRGIIVFLAQFHILDAASSTYAILNAASNGIFTFLPILAAFSAAKKLDVNPFIAACIAAALIDPSFSGLLTETGNIVRFFGIPVAMFNYSASLIPALLSTWMYFIAWKWLQKKVPTSIAGVLNPTICLIVFVPLTAIVFGPIAYWFGEGIGLLFDTLNNLSPVIAGIVVGVSMMYVTITGLHWVVTALCLTEFAAQGYSILFGYWWTACISVIGIALGALLVARNKEERSLALSCSLVAIFGGVSEPTLFSYLLRNKRYAIPMAIGGALGGGLAGLLGTKATSFCMATIFTVPLVEMGGSFVTSAIVFLAEIAAGMIATVLFVGKKQKAAV